MAKPFEVPEGTYNMRFVDSSNNMVAIMEIGEDTTFIALLDLVNGITDLWEVDSGEFTYCHVVKGQLAVGNEKQRQIVYQKSRKKLVNTIKNANSESHTPGRLLKEGHRLRDILKKSAAA